MSGSINSSKEQAQGYQPLLLVDFTFSDGSALSVGTHPVTWGGVAYQPRLLAQTLDPIQALSAMGIDIAPQVKLRMADADKMLYGIQKTVGFRGAIVQLTFAFYDFATQTFSSDATVPFLGICGRPGVDDETLSVTVGYILNLQAVNLPGFPIQQRCPKLFPSTAAQKALINIAGSDYYECGANTPNPSCDFTKVGCAVNGNSPRFGGVTYVVPPGSHSEEYTTGQWMNLASDPCTARYGSYAPIGYGTALVNCLNLGTFPDANSTRGEAIVCEGEPEAIAAVIVANETLPPATDVTGAIAYGVSDPLFRYNVISSGGRDGRLNFDTPWNGQGDPQGSLCKIEWCTYHSITSGTPSIQAQVTFPPVLHYLKIDHITNGVLYLGAGVANVDCGGNAPFTVTITGNSNPALNGTFELTTWAYGPPGSATLAGTTASGTGGYVAYLGSSDDYAWAIAGVMRRCGLAAEYMDLDSFIDASAKYAVLVDYTVEYGMTYASGINYSAGDVVTYGGKNYVSLQDDNQGHEPDQPAWADWWSVSDASPAVQPTGVTSQHRKYTCSLVVTQRRSAADIVTGMLRGCNSHLGRNPVTGQISLIARGTLAEQQPAPVDGSNDDTLTNGGYVAYHFDESSMVRQNRKSTFKAVERAAQSVPNCVTIPFQNEDNAYSGDSCVVVDQNDIDRMGQTINGSFPVDGCNSLDRANRVGAIYIAEQVDGEVYQWVTTAKAVKLQVGQIIAVSNAKHGFDHSPFRVQQIAPAANWETCTITAALHDDAWYADDFSVMPSSTSSLPQRVSSAQPPQPWCPYSVHPIAGDPLYPVSEWTFELQATVQAASDGSLQAVELITGAIPVSSPVNLKPPVIGAQGFTAASGGSLAGGGSVYSFALAAVDASGNPGPLSGICHVVIAQAGNTNTATIQVFSLDPAGAGWILYGGRNSSRLTRQLAGTGNPASVTLTDLIECGLGAPNTQFSSLAIRPRVVWHCGHWAAQVNTVGAGTLQFTGAGWPAGQWVGYDVTLLLKYDGSPMPELNFHVTASTADTLTVTPDPQADGIVVGDLIGMLFSMPTVTGLTVSDPNWVNTLSGNAGMTPHVEQGRRWRIVAGTGRGYAYPIADNGPTWITIIGPWIVAPDATSRAIIEDGTPLVADISTTPAANSSPNVPLTISISIPSAAGQLLSFEAVTKDAAGNESVTSLNPVRMAYVQGTQGYAGTVAVAGRGALGTGTMAVRVGNRMAATTSATLSVDRVVMAALDVSTIAPAWVAGSTLIVRLVEDAVGGHAITWGTGVFVDPPDNVPTGANLKSTMTFFGAAGGLWEYTGGSLGRHV